MGGVLGPSFSFIGIKALQKDLGDLDGCCKGGLENDEVHKSLRAYSKIKIGTRWGGDLRRVKSSPYKFQCLELELQL